MRAVSFWLTWAVAALACNAQVLSQSGPDSSWVTTSGLSRWWQSTAGSLEAGTWYGNRPFYTDPPGRLGYVARGDWAFAILKVPLNLKLDVGNGTPERGQRNRFSIRFDRQALLQRAGVIEAEAKGRAERNLDSLRALRGECYRKLSQLQRLNELGGADTVSFDSLSNSLDKEYFARLSDTAKLDPRFLQGTEEVDSALVDSAGFPWPGDSLSSTNFPGNKGPSIGVDSTSLRSALDSLRALDGLVAASEQQLKALLDLELSGRKAGFVQKLAHGLRRFEVGQCSPAASEFLFNGIQHVGLSFELVAGDVYLSFDHGRSYDDSWRWQEAGSGRLQRLQRTVFFEDSEDLNPRKLTGAKVGLGLPEGTHLHLGYLFGKREDAVLGQSGSAGSELIARNHVVEIDAGWEVAKGHILRAVVGRSAMADAATDGSDIGLGDILERGERRNQAVLVGWRSLFDKSRTEVTASYRVVDPLFYSMGMAFVRTGWRTLEGSIAQRIGKRFRLKATGRSETRVPLIGASETSILRGRIHISFRPSQAWSVRATYAPLRASSVIGDTASVVQRSSVWQCGFEFARRFGLNRLLLNADVVRYLWTASDSLVVGSNAWNVVGGASLLVGDRGEVSILTNGFLGGDESLWTASSRFTLKWIRGPEVSTQASWDVGRGNLASGNMSVKLNLAKRWYVRVEGMWCSDTGSMSVERFAQDNVEYYTCQATLGVTW